MGLAWSSDVLDYVQQKGWTWKAVGSEAYMTCPFCRHGGGKDDRFCIEPSLGVWHCHHCAEGGNLWQLKQRLGDIVLSERGSSWKGGASRSKAPEKKHAVPPAGRDVAEHEALLGPQGERALRYLTETRGFSVEAVVHHRLGWRRRPETLSWPAVGPDGRQKVDADGQPLKEKRTCEVDLVSVPFYAGGKLVNIKYRTIPPAPKDFRRVKDCASTLYGADELKPGPGACAIVVEGELDRVAAWQYGYENVVSGSTGAKGWDESWLTALDAFDAIYLALDNDASGDEGSERLAVALGRHRCHRVYLPMKDMNDCLAAKVASEQIQACFDAAQPYEVRDLVAPGCYGDRLAEKRAAPELSIGEKTGWTALDDLIGGWRNELVVVTGDTGSGKTTWCLNALLRRAAAGDPVAVFSFENPAEDVCEQLCCMEAGEDVMRSSDQVFAAARAALDQRPLWIFDHYGEIDLPVLKESVYYAVRRKMVRCVLLDHLHFFLKVPDPKYERQYIEAAMKEIRRWVKDLHVQIILVVHPKQTEDDNEKVGMSDLRGASAIKQAADLILRIWRKRDKDRKPVGDKPKAYITCLKARPRHAREGSIVQVHDPASGLFYEEGGRG